MSLRRMTAGNLCRIAMGLGLAISASSFAQYPGHVTKKTQDAPQLRAVAILEWTGEPGKPKSCRLVPVTVYDGERLNDAGVYLARPEPLALGTEVEYQLKKDGETIGLFDIKNTGHEQGSWVGYGEWKAVTKPEAAAIKPPVFDDDPDDDKPVLHRKHHDGDKGSAPSDTGKTSAPDDPDRPKLHKSPDASTETASAPADPDRPVLKKPKGKPDEDISRSESVSTLTDPDRPRLQRGRSNADNLRVAPSLMGLPPDMQQAIAVSDAQNHPDHPWRYQWANPGDEAKLKAQLEDMAREALGLTQPAPPPTAKPALRRGTLAARKAAQTPPPPPPAPATLHDEQFRVFELAYGSGATLVLTADTGGPLAQEKFITLIAQPDLYGNIQVLLKNVTNGGHLDDTPHMRIVDAVDALADNRGELLFELRGETSRQFALYRVLRGRAEKLFVSGGGYYGSVTTE